MGEPWTETMCDTCGVKPKRVTTVGRSKECETCGRYRRRTGRQRPVELILRQIEREQITCRHCYQPIVRCHEEEYSCLGWRHRDGSHVCEVGGMMARAEPPPEEP